MKELSEFVLGEEGAGLDIYRNGGLTEQLRGGLNYIRKMDLIPEGKSIRDYIPLLTAFVYAALC